jgi:hypothetical protein
MLTAWALYPAVACENARQSATDEALVVLFAPMRGPRR